MGRGASEKGANGNEVKEKVVKGRKMIVIGNSDPNYFQNSSESKRERTESGDLSPKPKRTRIEPETPEGDKSEKNHASRKEVHPRRGSLVQKNIEAELTSAQTAQTPDGKLLKYLQQLISEMAPSLETTGSASAVLELSRACSDFKFPDACEKAGSGVLKLREGLGLITEAETLFSSPPTNSNSTPRN
ncbi:hypothetical protein ACE6H2_021700 [Prunus campanulata]